MPRKEPESLFRIGQTDKVASVVSHLLSPRLRSVAAAVFGIAYLGIQGALIATAGRRPDHAYGFWMFHESSTVELKLFRVVLASGDPSGLKRLEVPAGPGEWNARDGSGVLQPRSWRERVKQPELGTFGQRIPAAYGAQAVTTRLLEALVDVSEHMDDADTCRFEIDARVWRNGRDEGVAKLRGPWRCAGKVAP